MQLPLSKLPLEVKKHLRMHDGYKDNLANAEHNGGKFFKKVSKQVNSLVSVSSWNTHLKKFPNPRKSTFLPPHTCLALLFIALRQQQKPPTFDLQLN